jgi:malate synthase
MGIPHRGAALALAPRVTRSEAAAAVVAAPAGDPSLEEVNVGKDDRSGSIDVARRNVPGADRVLTPAALELVARLQREFGATRDRLLAARAKRQREVSAGWRPDFATATGDIRRARWKVATTPADLEDRRVEITGPVDAKMMINALNSGANVFMADFEDACSPTWENIVAGQANLQDAVRHRLEWAAPDGKRYRLDDRVAALMVRPRGWHLEERHALVDGEPVSASLFDFGLFMAHNAAERVTRGSAPYFYLPKLESHLEARLWNDVFAFTQDALALPRGTIRATVLIENVLAAFEMDEILYELRDHCAGLNAGRWDYLFSIIRKFRDTDLVLPDRGQVTMTVPFMRAYTELLVRTCHRRGAHAIGGMAAFIPSRRDSAVNERALAKVREDKQRESGDGFDGTWVAHPDLVPVARAVFDDALGPRPNQKERLREEVRVSAAQLLDFRVPGGTVTEAGVRHNVDVGLKYLDNWLSGTGAAAIHNLMEDVATAEISRAQLWEWVHRGARLADGRRMDAALYRAIRNEVLARTDGASAGRLADAAAIMDELVEKDEFTEFLTLIAYPRLDSKEDRHEDVR